MRLPSMKRDVQGIHTIHVTKDYVLRERPRHGVTVLWWPPVVMSQALVNMYTAERRMKIYCYTEEPIRSLKGMNGSFNGIQ
jgi:hypothetical protein